MKKANGQGTVYKLKGDRKRPYCAKVTKGWTINEKTGKKKQIVQTIGYFETLEKAEKSLKLFKEGEKIPKELLEVEFKPNVKPKPSNQKYFIYIVSDGKYCKIGKTNDMKKRLKNLQNGNPKKLDVIALYSFANEETTFFIETKIHHKLKNYNVLNEWFYFENIQDLIKDLNNTLEWNCDFLGYETIL